VNAAFTPSLGIKWDSTLLRSLSSPIQNLLIAKSRQSTIRLRRLPAAANFCCLPAASSSQPGCRQPASQRRRAQSAATASLRMPPHGGSPASYSSRRLAAGLPSGVATMQMGNLRQKPGAIVFPGAWSGVSEAQKQAAQRRYVEELGIQKTAIPPTQLFPDGLE
jgi:hypothetical protein